MKMLQKVLFVALLLATSLTLASAQAGEGRRRGNMDPEKMAERQTAQMSEQLGLSEAQTTKIGEVNLVFAQKMKTMREEANGEFEGMREKMQAMREEQTTELKKYLTSEQFEKWEKLQKEQRGNRGRRGEGRRPGGGGK